MTNCTYFVEGLCEKQLIDSLKNTDLLIPGKVKVFNVVQADLKPSDLTSSKSNKDFKRDFILLKDLPSVLRKHCFDINKMWRQPVPAPFCQNISNNGA